MAVTKADKEQELQELTAAFNASDTAILVDYKGLNVPAVTELRRQIRGAKAEYKVVKNTLARRALAGGRYESLAEHLSGPNAFALAREDVVVAAKILTEFARDRDRPQIRAGAIEGRVVSIDEIRRIAELPPRPQLLAQVVGTMRAPVAGLAFALGGLLSKFVRTVDALREQKQKSEGAAVSADPAASAEDVENA